MLIIEFVQNMMINFKKLDFLCNKVPYIYVVMLWMIHVLFKGVEAAMPSCSIKHSPSI